MKKNENTQIILKTWKKEEELILKEWADKAICYKWLHLKSHERFRSINAYYTIPVIILSTVTGTANFAQDRVPVQYLNYYVMTVGALNLIAGIISTIHQYLKIAQINEAHRVAYIAWDKFSRNIRIELAKNPKERTPVGEMLKTCKEEYDRLEETSPAITGDEIYKFQDTFGEIQGLIKPDILGKLTPTMIFDREEHKNDDDDLDEIQRIVNENSTLMEEKGKLQKEKEIENMKTQFLQTKGRLPSQDEIEDFVFNKA
jgi:hypothetical protein